MGRLSHLAQCCQVLVIIFSRYFVELKKPLSVPSSEGLFSAPQSGRPLGVCLEYGRSLLEDVANLAQISKYYVISDICCNTVPVHTDSLVLILRIMRR